MMNSPLLKNRLSLSARAGLLLVLAAGSLTRLAAQDDHWTSPKSDYSTAYRITTFAGEVRPGRADTVNAPSFNGPSGVAVDRDGNLFIADGGNNLIRRIAVDGTVSTIAGSTDFHSGENGFSTPKGLAVDASGNLYVADSGNDRIRKITPAGVLTTFAGGYSGSADGVGATAGFSRPGAVAVAPDGSILVADSGNDTIRKITPAGVVTTLAGSANGPVFQTYKDGTGSEARFDNPSAITVDGEGNAYVVDAYNYRVRKVTPEGVVTTLPGFAGPLKDPASSTSEADFFDLHADGIARDATGNIWLSFPGNHKILRLTPAGVATTFAGGGYSGAADGAGRQALFNGPTGLSLDAAGNLIVADSGNHKIRKITPAGVVTTVMGDGEAGDSNGNSPPGFRGASGIVMDAGRNLFVADSGNNKIRKITPDGVVTTFAGSGKYEGKDGVGTAASFSNPRGIALDAQGNLYIADSGQHNQRIRKITPDGVVTTLAGTGPHGSKDGIGTEATFNELRGITVDGGGNVYVTDTDSIRRITAGGMVTTLALDFQLRQLTAIAADAEGNLFVASNIFTEISNRIYKISPAGAVTFFTGASLTGNGETRMDDGLRDVAIFGGPRGITLDGKGNIYVGDTGSNRIRRIGADGVVRTLAGAGPGPGVDATGSAARFNGVTGIAVDADGTLYIADSSQIRKGVPAAVQTIQFGNLANRTVGDGPITLSATSSSGLPVSFSIVSGGATISGNRLTLKPGVTGLVRVRASQPGNAEFSAAPHVERTFGVAPQSRDLAKLTLRGGAKLSPAFTAGIYTYTVYVGKDVDHLDILPVAFHTTTEIFINGKLLAPGTKNVRLPLPRALNEFRIKVHPVELGGITTKARGYNLNVIRGPSPVATLSSLTVKGLETNLKFTGTAVQFFVEVPATMKEVRLAPVTTSELATMTVNGKTLKSGTYSKPIPLKTLDNEVSIIVTAQNNKKRTFYLIHFIRRKAGAAAPASLARPASVAGRETNPLAAWFAAGGPPEDTVGITVVGGRKYRTLTVHKSPGSTAAPVVEVSPNLTDWYSGKNHTTVLRDTPTLLQVRDNTPLRDGVKRHIRVRWPATVR